MSDIIWYLSFSVWLHLVWYFLDLPVLLKMAFFHSFSWMSNITLCVCITVQFSRSVMSDSLWLCEPQGTRPPCPSPMPGVYPNSWVGHDWRDAAAAACPSPGGPHPQGTQGVDGTWGPILRHPPLWAFFLCSRVCSGSSAIFTSSYAVLNEIYPEYSLEGLMLKLKLQRFGPLTFPMTWLIGKVPDAGKDWR